MLGMLDKPDKTDKRTSRSVYFRRATTLPPGSSPRGSLAASSRSIVRGRFCGRLDHPEFERATPTPIGGSFTLGEFDAGFP